MEANRRTNMVHYKCQNNGWYNNSTTYSYNILRTLSTVYL